MASPLAQMLAQASASGANPQPFRATVAPTDVEKAYSDYNAAMSQAYKDQIAQQNAMWGGLSSLGSAGISTLPKLLASAAPAAAGAAGADISAAAMTGLTDALGAAAIL
jgi:hypothetical protein